MNELWNNLVAAGESGVDLIDNLFDVLSHLTLYFTIAVIVALIAYRLVAGKDNERASKISLGIAIGYSVGVIVILGALKLIVKILDGKIDYKFWLVIGFLATVLVAVAVVSILKKRNVSFAKWIALAFAVIVLAYAIVLVCVIPAKKADYEPLSKPMMYIFSSLLAIAIALLALLLDKSKPYDSRSLTYAAVCIATSFALSYIKFFTVGAQGGSVTFASLLPLALYAYMFGPRKGVVAGIVYGLLQFIQSPQFYEPMQALLDYPIAFGAIGLAGIGRKFKFLKGNVTLEFCIGTAIAVVFRYIAHSISGYFVFSSWAWEGYGPLAYSLAYNSFVFVDLAVVLVVAVILFTSVSVRRMVKNVGTAATTIQDDSQTGTANN